MVGVLTLEQLLNLLNTVERDKTVNINLRK